MINFPSNVRPVESPLNSHTASPNLFSGTSTAFLQISIAMAAARAGQLQQEMTDLNRLKSDGIERALSNAWDTWCDAVGKRDWISSGKLELVKKRNSGSGPGSTPPLERPIRIQFTGMRGTHPFPSIDVDPWGFPTSTVRFNMPQHLDLAQLRNWTAVFEQIDQIPEWSQMLARFWKWEVHRLLVSWNDLHAQRSSSQSALDEAARTWVEGTFRLLKAGHRASIQGTELFIDEDAFCGEELPQHRPALPFIEWNLERKHAIVLAFQLVEASKGGKRWLVEGIRVSDDLFSAPQGQTPFSTWKREADLKAILRDHFLRHALHP